MQKKSPKQQRELSAKPAAFPDGDKSIFNSMLRKAIPDETKSKVRQADKDDSTTEDSR